MTAIAKAKREYIKTGSFSVSSAKTGINRNTLKTWARRYGWFQKGLKEVKPEVKPKGQWMQSLHHDCAHYVTNGLPACHGSPTGAKLIPGMQWMPHTGLRQCRQCMSHAT